MADNKKKESSPPLLLLPSDMQLPNFLGGNILIPAAPAESTFLPITRPKSSEPGDNKLQTEVTQSNFPTAPMSGDKLIQGSPIEGEANGSFTAFASNTPHSSLVSAPSTNLTHDMHRSSSRPQYAQHPGLFPSTKSSNDSFSSASASVPIAASLPPMSHQQKLPPSAGTFISAPPQTPPQASPLQAPPQSVPSSQSGNFYIPVQHHWFYSKYVEQRFIWLPMSVIDSLKLEDAYLEGLVDTDISTDGGRYDVNISRRSRSAVYWQEPESYVRRCSWFFKPEGENRFVPYEEEFSFLLENEFHKTVVNNSWHQRIELFNGEAIVIHSHNVIVHFVPSVHPDEFGTVQTGAVLKPTDQARPIVVKRGVSDFDDIQEGEPPHIDHVVFVVHGIGSTCDLRFRNIIECVDDFRSLSLQILQSHFRTYQEQGTIGRVEFLPVRWHSALHEDASGVDNQLKSITLPSIGRLRHFTNDTLLDILFYASPTYAQKIADTVGLEIDRLYSLFMSRNPYFAGGFSLAGHSLGSLIIFDILAHQNDDYDQSSLNTSTPVKTITKTASLPVILQAAEPDPLEEPEPQTIEQLLASLNLSDYIERFKKEQISDVETLMMCTENDIKEMGLPLGPRKKLLSFQQERHDKKAKSMEESASVPVANESLNDNQTYFHQHDTQPTSDPLLHEASSTSVNFVMSTKGTGLPYVKYPKLQFPVNCFFALGSPIAMFLTVRGVKNLGEEFCFPTCPMFFNIFHPFDPVAYRIEPLVSAQFPTKPVLMPHHKGRKRLHLELRETMSRVGYDLKQKVTEYIRSTWRTISDFASSYKATEQEVEKEVANVVSQMTTEADDKADTSSISSFTDEDQPVGSLNQGRRIDYVLQEKPIESFNDYLFALGSHACYWESEDTVLMLLREIYRLYGVSPAQPGQQEFNTIQPVPFASGPSFPPSYSSGSAPLPPYASRSTSQFANMSSFNVNASGPNVRPGSGGIDMMYSGQGISPSGISRQSYPSPTALYSAPSQQSMSGSQSAPPPLTGFVPKTK